MSVEDDNVSVDQVAFNLETRLRVTIAVNGCKTVFDCGSLAVELINWAEAVRTGYFQVGWEGFWVCFVSLGKFVHPAIMKDRTWVVFWKWFSTFINTLQVQQCCSVVYGVSHIFYALVHSTERDLLLNNHSR